MRHTITKNCTLAVMMLLSMLLLPACFGNKSPERTYFSIDYALVDQPHYDEPKYDASIVIHNFTTTTAYDRQEIIYRSNPYEFQYYWYRLWASKPRKMLRELVSRHLRYTNIFADVTLAIEDRVPDYEMDVEITAVEELDASNTEWYAHLAMRMTVTSFEDREVLWSRDIDVKNSVADNQPVYVVKAMSELLDSELTKAFRELDEAVSRRAASPKNAGPKERFMNRPADSESAEADEPAAEVPTATERENTDSPRAVLRNRR